MINRVNATSPARTLRKAASAIAGSNRREERTTLTSGTGERIVPGQHRFPSVGDAAPHWDERSLIASAVEARTARNVSQRGRQ
jgi:hypothetical protein